MYLRIILLILVVLSEKVVAQHDQPPPPPPPDLLQIGSRQLAWTAYERKDIGLSASFPTEDIVSHSRLWHLGCTEFMMSRGLKLQTTIEHTTLFAQLRTLSTDSLARRYWTPEFLRKHSILLQRDTAFVGVDARYIELTNKLDGARWRFMLVRPDSATLLAFETKVYDKGGMEDKVADKFFASIHLHQARSERSAGTPLLILAGGQHYVNDTLGYSINVHRPMVSSNTQSQGPITVCSRVTDVNDIPAVFIISALREPNPNHPPLTAPLMASGFEQQGFNRRLVTTVDERPAVLLDMTNESGEYWQSYVIESSGDVIHSVLIGVPGYWGSAFGTEVISTMRIKAPKKP